MGPVIAIIGKPNVGKSSLFNRLIKEEKAIVADFSGSTRGQKIHLLLQVPFILNSI